MSIKIIKIFSAGAVAGLMVGLFTGYGLFASGESGLASQALFQDDQDVDAPPTVFADDQEFTVEAYEALQAEGLAGSTTAAGNPNDLQIVGDADDTQDEVGQKEMYYSGDFEASSLEELNRLIAEDSGN